MKVFGISLNREYILHYMESSDKIWFYDEPVDKKIDLQDRLQWLRGRSAKIKIKTRFIIEI